MKNLVTTDGNRLYQENIIKTINKMIGGGDEDSDPTTICASGGAAQAAPPDSECCEEIKPKIDAIAESIEELKTKPPFDLRVELKKILDGASTEAASPTESKDYSEKLEEIKHLIESQKQEGCDTDAIVEKLKGIVGQNPSHDYDAKFTEIVGKVDALNEVVTQNIATEIGEINEKVSSILEILGQARGNISKLLSKGPVGKSGLEIKAALIMEKAAQASAEADKALAELDLIKKNATKPEEDIEAAIDKATNSRNKADKLITEAQQLWELIEPSTNNSSSQNKGPAAPAAVVAQEAKEPEALVVEKPSGSSPIPSAPSEAEGDAKPVVEKPSEGDAKPVVEKPSEGDAKPVVEKPAAATQGPNVLPASGLETQGAEKPAVIVNPPPQRGGRGSDKNHEVIDSAKVKLNALTASVADAKEIIKKRRSTKGNSAKNVEIADLKAKIAAYEHELAELKKVGKDGAQIAKAIELEAKVRTLTELITSITGPSENLAKAVANHKAADNKASEELKELQTKLAGIPDLETLKTKLAGALEKISILEKTPDTAPGLTPELGEELKQLRKEVETAHLQHVSDEEETRSLKGQIDTLKASLKDLQDKYDKLVDEHTKAKTDLEKTVAKIATLEAANTSGKDTDELSSLKAKLAEKIAEVERITAEKAAIHKELSENQATVAELRQSLAEKQSGLKGLEEAIATLKTEKAALESRLANNTTNKNASAKLRGELDEAARKIADLTEKKGQLEANVSKREQKAKEDAAEIGRLTKELSELNALYEPLKKTHAEITTKLAEVNAALASMTNERDSLAGKISALESEIEALKGDDTDKQALSAITAERDDLRRRKEKIEADLGALTGDKTGLQSRVMATERDLESVRLDLQGKNAELSTLKGDLATKNDKISALDAQLQAALREVSEMKRLAQSMRGEIAAVNLQKSALEKRIAELEAELSGLRGKNTAALGKIKLELDRVTTEKASLDEQLYTLRESEKEANKRANIAEGAVKKCGEREAETKRQLQEALAGLDELNRRCGGITLLQSQLATWKKQVAEKLEEISILKQQKAGDSGRSAQLETDIKRLQGQMAGQALAHTKETDQIKGQLQKAQAEIASLTSQLSQSEAASRLSLDAERQIEAIRTQCAEREAHLQSLLRGRTVTEAVAREPGIQGKSPTSSYAKAARSSGFNAPTASSLARQAGVPGAYTARLGQTGPRRGGKTIRKGARLAKTKKNISPLI
jgi:chromosome segregation ATPase